MAKSTAFNAGYYGGTWAQTQLVKGQYIHERGYAGKGKYVAVFDGGFTGVNTHRGFDSLRAQNSIIDVHNFVLDTTTVYNYDDHGMAALSTIAANVADTFVGSAPKSQYALYVTEDGQSEQLIELFNFLFATERADSVGIDVISCSLGYNTFDNPDDDLVFSRDCDGRTTVAAKAVNMASAKGMIVVISAGNDGLSPWGKVLTPGDADSALTIGSVTGSGAEVYSSGKGPNASGVVKPDVCALGELSAVLTLSGYGQRAGTSFATPQIAGWVACIWGALPTLKASVLRKAIRSCASQYRSPTAQMGYGIPDLQCVGIQLQILNSKDTSILYNDITLPFQPIRDIYLDVTAQQATLLQYVLCDITGRVLSHQVLPVAEGKQRLIITDVVDFPTGMYILSVQMGQQQRVFKIIKM
jgi:subtilisin family serine protease